MYFFCIIDDNQNDLDRINNMITRECEYNHISYQCDQFTSIHQFDSKKHYDAIFLDIDMPEENGISFARKINQYIYTKIIFVSHHKQYIHTSMDAHPFHFICKDNLDVSGMRIMKQLFKSLNKDEKSIKVIINNIDVPLKLSDIYYIDIDDHLCLAHFYQDNHCVQIRDTISSLNQKLKYDNFIQVNRSTLINFIYIKNVYQNKVILRNNMSIPITAKYLDEFLNSYKNYLLRGHL